MIFFFNDLVHIKAVLGLPLDSLITSSKDQDNLESCSGLSFASIPLYWVMMSEVASTESSPDSMQMFQLPDVGPT